MADWMRALQATEILAWRAQGLPPGDLAASLLACACPELSPEQRDALPVGERDRLVLDLRERTLGPALRARAECPACGESLALELHTAELRAPPPKYADTDRELERHGFRLRLRPPSGRDLAAAAADPCDPRSALLARCVRAERDGVACPIEHVPADLRTEALERLAALDPQADVRLGLRCPACEHMWTAGLDLADGLTRELLAWAEGLASVIALRPRQYASRLDP